MNNTTLKRCLVLGANGFIGSHIVDKLAEAGYLVRGFDRFSKPPQFKQAENVEVFEGDFFDDMTVRNALKDVAFLFHSFSASTPFTADSDPYTDINSNLLRNIQLFEKSVEAGVEKVIYLSSGGAVYGEVAENRVVSEEDAPDPVSPYGIAKLASEHYLMYFNRKYGLDYVSFRLSNPYGPRQVTKHNQGVIPLFIEKIRAEEEITVIGDGSSSRDYIYIEDAVTMLVDAFEESSWHLYNLGSGRQTSVNEIIATLSKLLGKQPKIRYAEEPKTFLKHAEISIERYQSEFGERQFLSLENGLAKTISV
jgi:UDP-glucose 4-epimerase